MTSYCAERCQREAILNESGLALDQWTSKCSDSGDIEAQNVDAPPISPTVIQISTSVQATDSLERAVEKLCRRRPIVVEPGSSMPNGDVARFDQYWETLIPRPPVVSRLEPLAKSVTLVPIAPTNQPIATKRPAGEALSAWLKSMLADF